MGSSEAGSAVLPSSNSFVAFDSLSLRVESPSSRVQRVTSALHTLHGRVLDFFGTLHGQGVSDNDTIRIFCRLRGGSNNTDVPGQWQCANRDATRCWPVRRNCYRCGAPRLKTPPTPAPWNTGRTGGRNKGPLGRDPPPGPSNVPPTTREPRVVPPRGPPGAGFGTPPKDADSAVLPGELLGALKLLQTVMSAEDFSGGSSF